jgi:hypothetical protein
MAEGAEGAEIEVVTDVRVGSVLSTLTLIVVKETLRVEDGRLVRVGPKREEQKTLLSGTSGF